MHAQRASRPRSNGRPDRLKRLESQLYPELDRITWLHTASPLCASQADDDRGESVHVPLKDHIIGNPPALPAHLKILNDLVHGTNEDIRGLEDVCGAQLWPPTRQFLRRNVAMVRYLHPLH